MKAYSIESPIKVLVIVLCCFFFVTDYCQANDSEVASLETVTGEDLNLVINHILGMDLLEDPTTFALYDMNEDGTIDGSDLNFLIDIALDKRIDMREMKRTGIIRIGDAQFTMIKVKGGTLNHSDGRISQINDFWIMETEMTNEVAKAIKNRHGLNLQDSYYSLFYNMTSSYSGGYFYLYDGANNRIQNLDNFPCFFDDLDQVNSMVSTLSNKMGLRIPTNEEWEYAALGGTMCKGYTYSGSDILEDVACYSGHSMYRLSNNIAEANYPDNYENWHAYIEKYGVPNPVKMKNPNELGIYDMSGNASEIAIVSNATYLPDNGRIVFLGGSAHSKAEECKPGVVTSDIVQSCASCFGVYFDSYHPLLSVGLRLVMDADPEPEASPVVTVESGVIKSCTVAATTVNESNDTQSLNTQNTQP